MRGITCILFAIVMQSCVKTDEAEYLKAPENKYIICRGSALYLDNGTKWKVNAETTKGINKMIADLDNISIPSDTSVYHNLADKLMEDYIYILNYCEVMGNNHELVHSYLYPLQDLIMPMQIGGAITCEALLPKLKEYLETYNTYFE